MRDFSKSLKVGNANWHSSKEIEKMIAEAKKRGEDPDYIKGMERALEHAKREEAYLAKLGKSGNK